MKILLVMVVVQFLNLLVFAWLRRVAFMRILALRQQLCVYKRKWKPPKLRKRDRLFWSLLSRIGRTSCRAPVGLSLDALLSGDDKRRYVTFGAFATAAVAFYT
jgi:hypothetical protein